jgi:hypothetical protein
LIYNLYLKNSKNIGDVMCSPLDYFDFPCEVKKVAVDDYNPRELKGKFIIYGGGGLIHLPSPDYNNGVMQYLEELCDLSPWLVSWGVGHNIHGLQQFAYPESFVKKFRLHGVRDVGTGLSWVPCASCMSKLFGRKRVAKTDAVFVGHGDFMDLPVMNHVDAEPDKLIAFIGSAKTIHTNSYHGAYWGMLLNKKVVLHDQKSSKFFAMPKPVKGLLAKCRKANRDHHKKVLKLLEAYLES